VDWHTGLAIGAYDPVGIDTPLKKPAIFMHFLHC
jgi:hypothetical protein